MSSDVSAPPPPPPAGRAALWRQGAAAWDAAAGAPAPKLDVVQWRERFTWDEQEAFELGCETSARLRTIRANLDARGLAGRGVDPTSAKTAALTQMLADAGVLTAARRLAILAPVGTYAGEAGHVAPPDPPA